MYMVQLQLTLVGAAVMCVHVTRVGTHCAVAGEHGKFDVGCQTMQTHYVGRELLAV